MSDPAVNSQNGRFVCTADNPMPLRATGRWEHDAEEVGDQEDGWPGGDYQAYRCKNCGHIWKEELPQ
jgi:rubrerythrin